jgi:hypothetical protein
MRKLLSVFLSASLLFGIGTSVSAEVETNSDLIKVQQMISKTNDKIEKEIKKGVDAAEKLREEYLSDIRKLEEKDNEKNLEREKINPATILENASLEETKYVEIQELLAALDEEIMIEQQILEITLAKTNIGTNEINQTSLQSDGGNISYSLEQTEELLQQQIEEILNEKKLPEMYHDLTAKYYEKLIKIILNVFVQTQKLSEHTIDKVEELGFDAVCYWKLVHFADLKVYIDPISVVGRT